MKHLHEHKWVKEHEDTALTEAKCGCGAAVSVEVNKDGRMITVFEPAETLTIKYDWAEDLVRMMQNMPGLQANIAAQQAPEPAMRPPQAVIGNWPFHFPR
jgi:hypothetical protein